ncbi:MAG: AAA family ATPase [Candidatus Gastranaerophilaceae bacterium]|nr:AAA family ATPase [Candidatus Gastranaerophilaceae bacterium]
MRLSKIKLFNFRCFGEKEHIITIDDLTTFIGSNSTGKTAALAALNCMFSEFTSDRNIRRSDFYVPKNTLPENMTEQKMYIEAVFEFKNIREGEEDDSIPQFFEHVIVDTPDGIPYIRVRLDATWEKSNTIEGAIDYQIRYITCPESAEIEDKDYVNAQRRDLDKIRVIYVPAVRDPSKQLKNTSGAMMYQLINSINWKDERRNNIKSKIEELNSEFEAEQGVKILNDSLDKRWKNYDTNEKYKNVALKFNSADIETSIRRADVVFSPTETGNDYTVDQMSDGLKSLFYISLIDSILNIESTIKKEIETDSENISFNKNLPVLTIMAVEEPENHIAPHLLGRLVNNLKNIADKNNAQTIITSHSASIIKRVEPSQVRYFRVDDKGYTNVCNITLPNKTDEQYKYVKEAIKAYPELYFAKLIILGEGDSEELILSKLWDKYNGAVDLSEISIVPLGGRHVNHFWRLLNNLKIPYITLLDLDKERYGGGWGRIQYVIKELLNIGYKREDILKLDNGGILSQENLDSMHNWEINENMEGWMNYLENFRIFFSRPLDIDFLMLEKYENFYKNILENNEGPEIKLGEHYKKIKDLSEEEKSSNEFKDRISKDVKNSLKEKGGSGETYSEKQKELMIWYNYFFLNRGKPTTHMLMLSSIPEENLKANLPDVFSKIFNKAKSILKG